MIAISPALLISLGVSALLGVIGGSAFRWSSGLPAWDLFMAMFLWTLIASAGTIIGRFAVERLRRGEWQRGARIASLQSFPLMLVFWLVALLCGAPFSWSTLAVLFGSAALVALVVGTLGVLTSPFRQHKQ